MQLQNLVVVGPLECRLASAARRMKKARSTAITAAVLRAS